MLLELWWCHIRPINQQSINIATSILVGQRWHGIWCIRWIPTMYWRILWLLRCVLWRAGWLLMNLGQLRWINYWIIQCRRHMYHRRLQLIAILVTVFAMRVLVITRICSLPTLIFPCYTFVVTNNTLCTLQNEYNWI